MFTILRKSKTLSKTPDQDLNPKYSSSYRRYVLLALTGVYIFNFIDRQILVILQESIKSDLDLSDTQLGLLTGFAFALFYVTLGLPVARLADKRSRRNIITVALTIWSAMTALSGLAANFWQLLLARIGVGIGEAGGSPPAHSMISDYYPKEKRATALSIYSMGIYIGILLGYLLGGWLDEYFGWRKALMVLGVPGIVYALLFYFTVKEPERGHSDNIAASDIEMPSLMDVIKLLMSRKSFIYIAIACGLNSFVLYGVGNWTPSFLVRLHGMESGEIGTWLSLTIGVGGALGIWLGGYLGDRYGQVEPKWYLIIPAIAILISTPFTLIFLFSSSKYLVLGSIAGYKILWTLYLAPSIAMAHSLVGIRMRALASAVLFLVLNLIGLGLGPVFFGFISDYLNPDYGAEALRWSLSLSLVASLLAAYLFWKGSRYLREDIERAPV